MSVDLVVTKEAEEYLEALAEELAIPPGRYEQAVGRYKSLGDWFHRDASTVKQFDPQVYSQGSFRLGTAIKPENEDGQYDVDCVCELRALAKTSLTQAKLKEMLGYEVELYRRDRSMINPLVEGRRCWTLEYAEGAQFHLDIVPALPNGSDTRALLERYGVDARWADTAIAITDNEHRNYWIFSEDWPRSNPKGYAAWFKTRMTVILERKRRRLAEMTNASVESIPEHKVLTPLQQAIMILKRHRDVMFAARKVDRPISAIITTLAGHSYEGEETIGKALVAILSKMDRFIQVTGQGYYIPNPADPLENLADKWAKHPQRRDAFYEWLQAARTDFYLAAQRNSSQVITETVAPGIGRGMAERAKARVEPPRPASSLLRPATVAPAAVAPAFPAAARVPSKPAGFGGR
jgi:hypothetical protein